MMQLVTVEVALQDSAPALQAGIETALARWDFCAAWVVTDVDVQRQAVSMTALVAIADYET